MRPDASAGDLLWRLVVVVAAALSAALTGPTWLTTTLVVVASVAVAESLTRQRQLGWLDSLLVGAAGLLMVLALLGLVLNVLPGGLGEVSWAVGTVTLAFAAVVWGWVRTPSTMFSRATLAGVDRRAVLRSAPWYVAALLVGGVAIGISVHATDVANRAPIQLSSLGSPTAGHVVVQVSGGPHTGRYELVLDDGRNAPRQYGPFAVNSEKTVRVPLTVDTGARSVVTLRATGSTRTLRSLILNSTVGVTPPAK